MAREIAVVGRDEFVLGFQLAGIRNAIRTADSAAFQRAIEDVLASRERTLGILIVDAKDVQTLSSHTRKKLTDAIDPVVVQMGGEGGDLREKVKRAIGIDLYKE